MVDAPLADPVLAFLSQGSSPLPTPPPQAGEGALTTVLNTHHHPDHIGANIALKKATSCEIIGFYDDAHRIPAIDTKVKDGDEIKVCGYTAHVMFVPGHTLGHIAYYFQEQGALFCGDTLFAMGCGRLFEGTPQQMFDSLQKFKALPDETNVYCAHEYTLANATFSLSVDPDNKALQQRYEEVKNLRKQGIPTIPTTIGLEKSTNPFMRAKTVEEFARLRTLKDNF